MSLFRTFLAFSIIVPQSALGNPPVAIILDDLSTSAVHLQRAFSLPSSVTLSFLPYTNKLQSALDESLARGYEVLLHIPMEAQAPYLNKSIERPLTTNMSIQLLRKTFLWHLSQGRGYIGINNHMGSQLTQDSILMSEILFYMRDSGLYFLDSRTNSASTANRIRESLGMKGGVRDIFLDTSTSNQDDVKQRLMELERIALKNGKAIGICHPYDSTIAAITFWVQSQSKVSLVPLSQLLQ